MTYGEQLESLEYRPVFTAPQEEVDMIIRVFPTTGSPDEVVYVSVWEDVDSLRRFAGDRWQDPVIDPEEEHLLLETFTHHYESL